nr:reverse transcriptase domain-containing protein [Tanacetum cinerariifolium]
MTTQSAGQPVAASRGGGKGGRAGRGGGRNGGLFGDQGDSRNEGQAQVGGQGGGQGNGRNQNGDAVNDNIWGDVGNVLENNDHRGCTYKDFLACNPKKYDGKGGAIVYTRWIEKMESVQDMSGCRDSQKVKYTTGMSWEDFKTLTREEFCSSNDMQKLENKLWNHAMVGAGHAVYTDRFHELARNGSIKKNSKKRGSVGEPSKDRNVRDDNKRTRTRNAFTTTANPVRREYTGTTPKNVNPVNARNPTARACCECCSTDHVRVMRTKGTGKRKGIHVRSRGGSPGPKHHDKIPPLDGKVLRVLGEKPKEKMRQLMSAKAKEKEQEEIVVVRDFPRVFPNDPSGLPLV